MTSVHQTTIRSKPLDLQTLTTLPDEAYLPKFFRISYSLDEARFLFLPFEVVCSSLLSTSQFVSSALQPLSSISKYSCIHCFSLLFLPPSKHSQFQVLSCSCLTPDHSTMSHFLIYFESYIYIEVIIVNKLANFPAYCSAPLLITSVMRIARSRTARNEPLSLVLLAV